MRTSLSLLALLLAGRASALILDDFTTGPYASDGRGTFAQAGSMLGGSRSVSGFFDDLDDTTLSAGAVGVSPAEGFTMRADAGRASEFEQILSYPRLSNLDLSAFRAVRLEFSTTDFAPYVASQPDLGLGINVEGRDGTDYRASLASRALSPSRGSSVVEIAFSDFVSDHGTTPIDWRDVDGFGLYLGGTGASGGSLTLRRVEFVPVPEPTTLAALGVGAVALLRRRK